MLGRLALSLQEALSQAIRLLSALMRQASGELISMLVA